MELTSIRYSIRQLTVLVAMLTTLCVFGTAAMQPEQKQDKVLASEKMISRSQVRPQKCDIS